MLVTVHQVQTTGSTLKCRNTLVNFLASLDDWKHLDQRIWDYDFHNNLLVKGTGSLISSDPPCKNGNTRFTTVPLKALSDQVWKRYSFFCIFKLFIFIWCFSEKVTCTFLVYKKQFTEINTFWMKKTTISLPHFWSL